MRLFIIRLLILIKEFSYNLFAMEAKTEAFHCYWINWCISCSVFFIQILGVLVFSLALILNILRILFGVSVKPDQRLMTSFECGLDTVRLSRYPFSLQFFLVAIVFVIFDVELCLVISFPLLIEVIRISIWLTGVFVFVVLLVGGLYYEWAQGVLDWQYYFFSVPARFVFIKEGSFIDDK